MIRTKTPTYGPKIAYLFTNIRCHVFNSYVTMFQSVFHVIECLKLNRRKPVTSFINSILYFESNPTFIMQFYYVHTCLYIILSSKQEEDQNIILMLKI